MTDFNGVSTKNVFVTYKVMSYPIKAGEAEDFELIISKQISNPNSMNLLCR